MNVVCLSVSWDDVTPEASRLEEEVTVNIWSDYTYA